MMTHGNKRDESIDLARCISCIGVVIIHAIAVYWYGTPVVLKGVEQYFENESLKLLEWETLSWSLCSVIDAGARFSVPVFVMISGALLLNRKNGLDTAYIIKKCIHLVELILAWGGYTLSMILFNNCCLRKKLLLNSLSRIGFLDQVTFGLFLC